MMAIGEILWEGKGKTAITTVEDITAEGAKLNYTWSAELKGCGKAAGIDGVITFTGTKIAPLKGGGSGNTNGRGIFFTAKGGDMAVIKSSGYGNPRWKKTKSLEIWSFMTVSKKLNWLNTVVAIVTQEGDSAWKEFNVTINEWK